MPHRPQPLAALGARRKGHVRIGYARVSTCDQSTALQLDALREAGCTHVFEDKITGISRKRPGLEQALRLIGQGDELVVWRLDRLGRSLEPEPKVVEQYQHVVIHASLRRDGVNDDMDWYCPARA